MRRIDLMERKYQDVTFPIVLELSCMWIVRNKILGKQSKSNIKEIDKKLKEQYE